MATKTISVNPDFFSMTKKSNRKKTRKNSIKKNINMLQKNMLKQKMINKIKDYKKKKKEKRKNNDDVETNNNFKNDYNDAVSFMEDIIHKRKTKKHRKRKKEKQKEQIITVDTNDNNQNKYSISNIAPDPPYGILKNGSKMLYSKYRQNKEKPVLAFKDDSTFGVEQNIKSTMDTFENNVPTRQEKLEKLKHKFLENNLLNDKKKEKFKIKKNI